MDGYYIIKIRVFWTTAVSIILILSMVMLYPTIYEQWRQRAGTEFVEFDTVESLLKDAGACYLCGNSNRSLMGYYRKFDTLGIISLNDWEIFDLGLKEYDSEGKYMESESGTKMRFSNIGEVSVLIDSTPSRGMASVDIRLPESYRLDISVIQNHLCQTCLDKVTKSLEISKWKLERKECYPLCIVDFETLEIYALQDWHTGMSIRDYWVEMEYEENEIEVKVFYLPDRSKEILQ